MWSLAVIKGLKILDFNSEKSKMELIKNLHVAISFKRDNLLLRAAGTSRKKSKLIKWLFYSCLDLQVNNRKRSLAKWIFF